MRPCSPGANLVFALLGIALIALPMAAAQPSDTARGEWLVSGQESLLNGMYSFKGNITVISGGDLSISNSTLIFLSNNFTHAGFIIEEGGRISIVDSKITTANRSGGFIFFCHGLIEVQRSRIENIYDNTKGLRWIAGLRITSDNPVIEDSVFNHASGYALRFEGCRNVRFSNNTVTQASTAVLMNRSTGIIQDNWFHNNTDRQVVIQESDGVQFLSNVINETGMAALVVVGSKELKAENNTYAGPLYVIYAAESTLKLSGENISGEQIHLEALKNSAVTLFNCRMDPQKLRTKGNSNILIKEALKARVSSGGKPMPGAKVTVKDSNGAVVAEGTTDSEGLVSFVLKKAEVTDTGLKAFDPFEFKAVKGLYSASGSFTVAPNDIIELSMKLPWLYIIGGGIFLVLIIIVVVSPPKSSRKKSKRRR